MSLEEISGEWKNKTNFYELWRTSQEKKKIGLIDFDMEFIDFQHYLWNYNRKKELKTFVFTEAKQIWPQVSVKDKFKYVSLSWCLSKAIKSQTKHNKMFTEGLLDCIT